VPAPAQLGLPICRRKRKSFPVELYLDLVTAIQVQRVAQALWHYDAPGLVNGSFHTI